MTDNQTEPKPQYTGKRSPALTLTCILTLLWSGFTLLGALMAYGLYYDLPLIMQQAEYGDQEKLILEMIQNSKREFFLIIALLNALSFIGAILMWKLKKVGFHFYTTAQLLILVVPFFLVAGYSVSLPNAIITVVFIAAYAVNMPQMR
ncbi:MAG: hypothetical protein ACM3ME_05395 [Chloroflexota bacterium]